MLLSVVIPTCNRIELLEECLDSVLKQESSCGEIIVVNNGDHDLVLNDARYSEIRIINTKPRIGASRARNVGAEASKYDYIAFLDDDDYWEAEYLKKVSNYLTSKKVDLLITNKVLVENGLEKIKNPNLMEKEISMIDVFLKTVSIGAQAMVVNKLSFIEVGGFDPRYRSSNDKTLVMEFIKGKYKVFAYLEPKAFFRQHLGARLTDAQFDGNLRFFLSYFSYMPIPIKIKFLKQLSVQFIVKVRALFSRLF